MEETRGMQAGCRTREILFLLAVCVLAIPDGEVRYIKEVPVTWLVTELYRPLAHKGTIGSHQGQ